MIEIQHICSILRFYFERTLVVYHILLIYRELRGAEVPGEQNWLNLIIFFLNIRGKVSVIRCYT